MRTLVGFWRGLGRRVVMFLDGGIGGAPNFIACQEVSRLCRVDLEKAGFFINDQKSVWIPSQDGVWLGYCLDFSRCFISMSSTKIMKLKESISCILSKRFVTAKERWPAYFYAFGYWQHCAFNVSINVFPDFGASILVLPFYSS